jgi:hypothetical protein
MNNKAETPDGAPGPGRHVCVLLGMSPIDENVEAGDLQEQAARTRRLCEPGYGPDRADWPDPLAESGQLSPDELDLLQSHVPGHRWDGWRRLTGDEDYVAACSCGWRSPGAGQVGQMVRQVKDHLDAVRQSCGGRRSAQAPARDGRGRDAGQGEIPDLHERAREVRASVQGQQMRLSQSLRHSTDLLSASADQADQLVAALERRQWASAGATSLRAESVRHKVERARELRKAIAAVAAALAVMAEEIAWIHQDQETRRLGGSAGHQRMLGVASETAGTARQDTASSGSDARPAVSG